MLGDFRYFWTENIGNFAQIPSSWDASLNTGIGKSGLSSLWITSYLNFTAMFSSLGLSWELISLIFWILPAIIISFLSSFLLFNYLFTKNIKYSLFSGIIYTLNTYFLIILTGGQLGVSLAYSLVPLVLLRFIKIRENPSLGNALIGGLVLGLQLIFDPRIVYITLVAVLFYLLFNFFKAKIIKDKVYLIVPLFISILLNAFWILPLFITKNSPIPEGFNSVKGFEFFSFADFSHALSLLHPNWPENIFGKTYFMRPEFLILPILAYSSLLFISNIKNQISKIHIRNQKVNNNLTIEQFNNRTILFFAFLGILGAFLAKGANPPFGEINIWLFKNFPGMQMFRDPTKFYVLTALSYSVLIPFSVLSISNWLISNTKNKILNINIKDKIFYISFARLAARQAFLLSTILYLLFLIHPILLRPILKLREVPKEYIQLKDFLYNQPEFFRTLWIPQWQRFGYFSNQHPAIGREEIFKGNAKKQIAQLKKPNTERILRDLSVKYIIVPYDSEGEIFLDDRKYNEKKRREVEVELDKVSWFKKINRFNDLNHFSKITVYEIENPQDRFWSPSKTLGIEHKFVNPTKYLVQVKNAKRGDLLVFSEGFDRHWIARNSEFKVKGSRFGGGLNSFVLSKDGNYDLEIYYEPQKWVNIGLIISGLTLGSIALFFVRKYKKR